LNTQKIVVCIIPFGEVFGIENKQLTDSVHVKNADIRRKCQCSLKYEKSEVQIETSEVHDYHNEIAMDVL
jgi:hypothetical protein